MRILIVHNQLWAHYKAIIFNELQKIVTSKNNDELLVIQLASIEKSRLNLGNLDTTIHQYPYELIHDGVLEEVGLVQKIKGIIKNIKTFKPDIVNLTGYYDVASWVVLLYCRLKGIKTVLSNESTQGDHSREQHKELIKSLIIKQFDGYFNFGTLSKNYLISLGGKPEKMLINRNCVDNEALKKIYDSYYPQRNTIQQKIGTAKHNFIFVGRLIEFKNLFKFLEAFKNTSPTSDWGIIILGDGELKPKLQQYAVEKNIPNVQFLKGVSWQEVPQYLAISDVLVLPSYSEPWGLVVNEAMACGLPILVSEKCGCAIDLVQNEANGYTFSPSDTDELSNLMQKCMENPTHLKEMGKKSKQIIASYSPQNVAQEMYEGFLAVYNN